MRLWKHFFETVWTLSPLALWGSAALLCPKLHYSARERILNSHSTIIKRNGSERRESRRGIVVVNERTNEQQHSSSQAKGY